MSLSIRSSKSHAYTITYLILTLEIFQIYFFEINNVFLLREYNKPSRSLPVYCLGCQLLFYSILYR